MSDFYNKYPYTDFHELNLDWIIERVKQLTEDWIATQAAWEGTEADWQALYNYVHDYFNNLDVQDEINTKINSMISDGTFATVVTPIIDSQVADTVAAWLAAHITPTTPAIDNTLSVSGAGADAQKTGLLVCSQYSASSTYHKYDKVLYNGTVYICKSEITTAEAWNASHWTATNITKIYNQAFLPREVPAGTSTLASLNEQGVYYIPRETLSNYSDLPTGHADQIATLVNINNCYLQYTYQYYMNLDNKVWKRLILTSTGVVYADWERCDNKEIATVKADAFMPRGTVSGNTAISNLRSNGVYYITSGDIASYTDKPAGASNVISTVMNFTGAYLQYIYQYFMQLDGKIWRRLIQNNGTVYADWVRYDYMQLESEVFKGRGIPATVTSLSALRSQGVYTITQANLSGIDDLPTGYGNQISTLMNITDCYGYYIYQYFMQL